MPQQDIVMLKTPLQLFQDHYKDQIQRDQKKNEFQYSQTDTFITWLIGFAFSGLVLIVSNLNSFKEQFDGPFKPIIVCILAVIIFGIVCRFISFLIMVWEKELDEYYAVLFTKDKIIPVEPDFDIDNADTFEMVRRLNADFGLDHNNVIYFDDAKRNEVLPKLKEIYLKQCEESRVSLYKARAYVAHIEFETHRIPIRVNEQAFDKAYKGETKEGYHAQRWEYARLAAFFLTLLAFVSAILITGISLLAAS